MRMLPVVLLVLVRVSLAQSPTYHAEMKIDEQGIPHIRGATIQDVAYGSGRQQMADFPILTSFVIASASGSLAELIGLGSSPGTVSDTCGNTVQWGTWLGYDVAVRRWRVHDLAVSHLNGMTDQTLISVLNAFAAGLDAGRTETGCDMPTLADACYGNGVDTHPLKFAPWQLSNLLSRPITPLDVLQAAAFLQVYGGVASGHPPGQSNIWLLNCAQDGANGPYPLLMSDPHLYFDVGPSGDLGFYRPIFQTLHVGGLTEPETFKAGGWGAPGMFGILMGFNDHVVWGATSNAPDTVDFWEAPFTDMSHTHVMFAGATVSVTPNSSTYVVANSTGSYQVTLCLPSIDLPPSNPPTLQVHFPIVEERDPTSSALNGSVILTGAGEMTSPKSLFEFVYRMTCSKGVTVVQSVAQSVAAAMSALDAGDGTPTLPNGHFCLISREGHMRHWYCGRVPIRNQTPGLPADYYRCHQVNGNPDPVCILDGTIAANQWMINSNGTIMVHTLSQMPHGPTTNPTTNPEVWIANNGHPGFLRSASLDPQGYPFYGYPFYMIQDHTAVTTSGAVEIFPTLRQTRVRSLLVPTNGSVALSVCEHAARDVYDNWAARNLPWFQYAFSGPTTPEEQQAKQAIDLMTSGPNAYDFEAVKESMQAGFSLNLRETLLGEFATHPELYRFAGGLEWTMPTSFPSLIDPDWAPLYALLKTVAMHAASHYIGLDNPNRLQSVYFHLANPPWTPGSPDIADIWFSQNASNMLWLADPFQFNSPYSTLGQLKFIMPSTLTPLIPVFYPVDGVPDASFNNNGFYGVTPFGTQPVYCENGTCIEPARGGSRSLFMCEFKAPSAGAQPIAYPRYVTPLAPNEFYKSARHFTHFKDYADRMLRELKYADPSAIDWDTTTTTSGPEKFVFQQ